MFKNLQAKFDGRTELPIEIQDICDALVQMGYQDDIRVVPEEMDLTQLLGTYVQWREPNGMYGESKWVSLMEINHLKVGLSRKSGQTKAAFDVDPQTKLTKLTSEILSEGEQRALALAGFLTEVSLTEGSAAIVVDDPVSSLDRERCLLVAQRLAAESKNRQVIVFTHDIIFFNELCREADELGVEAVTTALFSDKKVAGRIDAGGVSWKGAKVNNRHSPSGPPLDFKIA